MITTLKIFNFLLPKCSCIRNSEHYHALCIFINIKKLIFIVTNENVFIFTIKKLIFRVINGCIYVQYQKVINHGIS